MKIIKKLSIFFIAIFICFSAINIAHSTERSEWVMDLVYIIVSDDTADTKMQGIISMLERENQYGNWLYSAMEYLATSGTIETDTIEEIGELLENSSWRIRSTTARAFAALSSGGVVLPDDIIMALTELLYDGYYDVSINSVRALKTIAENGQEFSEDSVLKIVECITDAAWHVKEHVPSILGKIAKSGQPITRTTLERLIQIIDFQTADFDEIACKSIGEIAEGGQAIPISIIEKISELAYDSYWYVRLASAESLGRIVRGGQLLPRASVESLIKLIGDSFNRVRVAAGSVILVMVGRDYAFADTTIKKIVDDLLDRNHYTRVNSRDVLYSMIAHHELIEVEEEDFSKLEGMFSLVNSQNETIKEYISSVIASLSLGRAAEFRNITLQFTQELDNDDPWIIQDIINTIKSVAETGIELPSGTINAATQLLDSSNSDVINSACNFFSVLAVNTEVVPRNAVTKIIALLGNNSVANNACLALGNIGKSGISISEDAVATLVNLLDSDDWRIRRDACWALGNIVEGGHSVSQDAIDALSVVLSDEIRFTRRAACWSLANVSKSGTQLPDEAIQGIIFLLDDNDWYVRRDACWVLSTIAQAGQLLPAVAVVSMIRLFDDSSIYVRQAACQAITRISESGQVLPASAVESIVRILSEDNMELHNTVRESLARIAQTGQVFPSSAINRIIQPRIMQQRVVMRGIVQEQNVRNYFAMTSGEVAYSTEVWTAREILRSIVSAGQQLSDLAISRIIQQLTDNDTYVRKAAYEVLGDIVSAGQMIPESLIQDIIYYIDEENESRSNVRQAACLALCRIAKAGQTFDNENLIDIIQSSLELIPDSKAVFPLFDLFLDQHPHEINDLIRALGQTSFQYKDPMIHLLTMIAYQTFTAEGLENTIFYGTELEVEFRRYSYIRLLKDEVPGINEYLMIGMSLEPNSYVKVPVIQFVGRLNKTELLPAVRNLLNDESAYVRMYAAAITGQLNDRVSIPSLTDMFNDARTTPNIKIWCAASLIRLGQSNPDYLDYIIGALDGKGEEYMHPDNIEMVFNGFSISDVPYRNTVRRTAVVALGDIGDENSIPYLIELLDDETYFQQDRETNYYYLRESLATLGDPALVALANMLSPTEYENEIEKAQLQRNALKMIFNLMDKEAVQLIEPHLNDMSPSVRSYADIIIERLRELQD